MPRIAIEPLHSMVNDIPEELGGRDIFPDRARSLAVLELVQHIDLLIRIEIGKHFSVSRPAALIHAGQSPPVRGPQVFKWPAKLPIDVLKHACPGRPRILVRRNNLIADCGETSSFIDVEEPPGRALLTASTRSGCGRCGQSSLYEGAAVYSKAGLHAGSTR